MWGDEGYIETVQGTSQMAEEYPATPVAIEDLATDDIVIAIMGPTGSGKSTVRQTTTSRGDRSLMCCQFIRSASGHDTQGVGHGLKSFTSQVLAIRFWDQECRRYVVLVDTPGFDDTFKSDLDILNMISDWLNSSYKKKKLLSGILYLHRITDNRMAGTPLKNLRVFRELCGKDALEKVYLTTTMWDEVEPRVGERRLDELKTDYWKTMMNRGAHIARCRSDDDSPQKLIRLILAQEDARKALLLQEEMGELKKELKETAAGQQLYSQLETLVEKQSELLRRINKERKVTSEASLLVELQQEYNDLRSQIDEKLHQMQELKLSPLQNLLRYVPWRRD
ncbi:hypothetical protein J3R83DRAFT_2463 [Lanmaoa asiatica]|nr:hypothetical protein J3R83DRAFT_2463 [Lanmaoa asiatica]